MTSGLVEVETTGPSATKRLGMTREDVFPEREGPRTSVERCGPAHDHVPFADSEVDACDRRCAVRRTRSWSYAPRAVTIGLVCKRLVAAVVDCRVT